MEKDQLFWQNLQDLVNRSKIIIDRPKGSCHPKFPEASLYPLDYSILKGTTSMDGQSIDCFCGSLEGKIVVEILYTVDMMKKDSEIKILIDCTESEVDVVHEYLNKPLFFKAALLKR